MGVCAPRVFCSSGALSFLAMWRLQGRRGIGSVGRDVGEGVRPSGAASVQDPARRFRLARAMAEECTDVCTVCLEPVEPSGGLLKLPCQHCFHARCIGDWALWASPPTCPSCRAGMEAEVIEELQRLLGVDDLMVCR